MRLPDLTQPTTQRGLVALLTLIASYYDPKYQEQIIQAGFFVYSLMLILVDEGKRG